MSGVTLAAPMSLAADCTEAFSCALAAVARKTGFTPEEVTQRLRTRDRMTWSRFRFELVRGVMPILAARFHGIRSAHLWEMDDAEPEAAESPATPTVDLVLRLEGNPLGLDDLAAGLSQELARELGARVPDTPLGFTVHLVSPAMAATGRGLAALLRGVHSPLVPVWTAEP